MKTTIQHQLKPLELPADTETARALAKYPKGPGGTTLLLFRVFANSYRFLTGKGVVNLLDAGSPLTLRQREMVILRVTALRRCEYEWGVHVAAFAEAAALTQKQIGSTIHGEYEGCGWTPTELTLLQLVEELAAHGSLPDPARRQLRAEWRVEQQLEILALISNYQLVAAVAGVAELPLETYGARFEDYAGLD